MALFGTIAGLFSQRGSKIELMEVDATISETHEASTTLTETEVESGAKINDHVTLNPLSLTIEGAVSENPISIIGAAAGAAASAVGAKVGAAKGALPGAAATVGIASIGGLVSSALSSSSGPKSRAKEDVYDYLMELRNNRQPITVVTGLKEYSNMIITSISIPRTAQTGQILRFTVVMRQVKIVQTVTSAISIDTVKAAADKGKNLGKQATKTASDKTGKGSSVLFKLFH